VLQRAVRTVAGIVDQHVDASSLALNRFNRGDNRSVFGQVELEQGGAGGGKTGHAIEATGAREHAVAGGENPARRGFSDHAPVTKAVLLMFRSRCGWKVPSGRRSRATRLVL